MKNIVIIGGGTGTSTLLSGLRQLPTNNAVIVSTADDGGSTGRLREELGVVPPGDIRQCLVGLSYGDPVVSDLFNYRFDSGSLKGHAVGNIIISALEKSTGSIEKAIIQTAKLLNVRGYVVPITIHPTILSATLEDGSQIKGEHNIDEPQHNGDLGITNLELAPSGPANPRALELIKNAQAIVFGPGDIYTSTVPNLLVDGVREAIAQSKAKKILVVNLMTKWGQTNGYKASDFVNGINRYLLPASIETVIVNTKQLEPAVIERYKQEKAEPFGFMEDVFVEENFRKHGIGSMLIKAIIEEAKALGCYKLICTSRYEKPDVHGFYKKFGFKEHGFEFRMDFYRV